MIDQESADLLFQQLLMTLRATTGA